MYCYTLTWWSHNFLFLPWDFTRSSTGPLNIFFSLGVDHHFQCCITIQYSGWPPRIPSSPVLWTTPFVAIYLLWVSPRSLSDNTPIHDIAVWGEPILMKKSVGGPFPCLWRFHSIVCYRPACCWSMGFAYTMYGLDSIITPRSPLESGNVVKTLEMYIYVDLSIQLATPLINSHQTPYRL